MRAIHRVAVQGHLGALASWQQMSTHGASSHAFVFLREDSLCGYRTWAARFLSCSFSRTISVGALGVHTPRGAVRWLPGPRHLLRNPKRFRVQRRRLAITRNRFQLKQPCKSVALCVRSSSLGASAECNKNGNQETIFTQAWSSDERSAPTSAVNSALTALEWEAVCQACASFASTSMGHLRLKALLLSTTREESESLLMETEAALLVESRVGALDFGGLDTLGVQRSLGRAGKSIPLSGPELSSVATLLETAHAMQALVTGAADVRERERDAVEPMVHLLSAVIFQPQMLRAVRAAVERDGTVKDSASPELRKARHRLEACHAQLSDLLNSRTGQNSGVQEVAMVNGRMCLLVNAQSRDTVPGVVRSSKSAGEALYVEPAGAVQLNNRAAEAAADVRREELAVLTRLTLQLKPHLEDVQTVLEVVVAADVAVGRARYGSSLAASRPIFTNPPSDSGQTPDGLVVSLRQVRHPVLVSRHQGRLQAAQREVRRQEQLLRRARQRVAAGLAGAVGGSVEAAEGALAAARGAEAAVEAGRPVAVDLYVRRGMHGVVLTGPNTGGKTLALKTLGLAVLMARAGLWVPAKEPAQLPWFSHVFADIGDSQSLTQSLSTFSGHLRRIQEILAVCNRDSLVLLDELGSGTDPAEGAALATALLLHLVDAAALTIATTHHGELKALKYRDARFENVSVEFNEQQLAPTYRLLWGIPGRSNALNIAERLGLPTSVVDAARQLHGTARGQVNEIIEDMEAARRLHENALSESEHLYSETDMMHKVLVSAATRLQQQETSCKVDAADLVEQAMADGRSRIGAMQRHASRTESTRTDSPKLANQGGLLMRSERSRARRYPNTTASSTPAAALPAGTPELAANCMQLRAPQVGDVVTISKLGSLQGKVVEVKASKGAQLVVQCGGVQMKLRWGDVKLLK